MEASGLPGSRLRGRSLRPTWLYVEQTTRSLDLGTCPMIRLKRKAIVSTGERGWYPWMRFHCSQPHR